MTLPLVPVLAIGGGVVYVASQAQAPAGPPTAVTASGGTIVSHPPAGVSLPQAVAQPVTSVGTRGFDIHTVRANLNGFGTHGMTGSGRPNVQPAPSNQGSISGDSDLSGKLAEVEDYAKAAYQNLDDAAKQKGAALLNEQLKLDPPLKGDEDWATISSVAGGAVGGAVGAYLGGPIGAKLGALVGAYLGVQLEDLISKNWDDLKGWLDNEWGSAKSTVEGWYDDAKNEIESWF